MATPVVHRDSWHGFWWISRPRAVQSLGGVVTLFERRRGVLMGAHDRCIDKEVTRQGIVLRLQVLPGPTPEPAPFLAAETVRDRVPMPKFRWQVAPRRPVPR